MVLKLLVFMLAVSALEGVFGLPDKQLVNGTQSKANVGHGKTRSGRRLDKLACKIFHGHCQRLDEDCPGIVEEGPDWCLHSRHFGCCIPQTNTLGCTLNFRTYRDEAIVEDMCIRLICSNGEWLYYDVNTKCGFTCIYGTTIMPFVPHRPLGDAYNITDNVAVYSLSQYGYTSDPHTGVDIYIGADGIECIVYYCDAVTVEICCGIFEPYPLVWVNDYNIFVTEGMLEKLLEFGWCGEGPVYLIFKLNRIYIIGPQLSVCINWVPDSSPWVFTVYVLAPKSLHGELYGLSGVWVKPPYPDYGIMRGGGETDDLNAFITSWQLPHTRSHVRHQQRKNPSSDHTGQVTVRPKIERSMTDIAKICEEMNKDLCTILPSEKCEKIMDYCMSSMSGLSDSSE